MNTYELTVDTSFLSIQQDLILVKEYEKTLPYHLPWAIFLPFPQNTLQWTRTFSLYVANLNAKNMITVLATSPIEEGKIGLFEKNRFTDMHDGKTGTFGVSNQVQQTLYFGLMQAITINEVTYTNNPISIACVPYNQTAEFTPLEYLTVFLGTGYEEHRLMSTKVHSEPLCLNFTNTFSIDIVYDRHTGKLIKR